MCDCGCVDVWEDDSMSYSTYDDAIYTDEVTYVEDPYTYSDDDNGGTVLSYEDSIFAGLDEPTDTSAGVVIEYNDSIFAGLDTPVADSSEGVVLTGGPIWDETYGVGGSTPAASIDGAGVWGLLEDENTAIGQPTNPDAPAGSMDGLLNDIVHAPSRVGGAEPPGPDFFRFHVPDEIQPSWAQ
jgi:hypothetical protein